ncbi:MAG: patatin-like phospholipase family protein [Nitrospira sp.]|nr:patatin-like phospholipase family protein [Nitrospira sp.]
MRPHQLTRRRLFQIAAAIMGGYVLQGCTASSLLPTTRTDGKKRAEEICQRGEGSQAQSSEEEKEKFDIDETGLCLSGGGYRAMLFHVGSLWRLYESGLLAECTRITSVSGGSITAAVLGLTWNKLNVTNPDVPRFVEHVVAPIRGLAEETIDRPSVLKGLFLPGSVSGYLEDYYNKYLFRGATLQNLPDSPRFFILATNVQSGALFRFSKLYISDYRVGVIPDPMLPIAKAVAASASFPPVLSPTMLYFNEKDVHACKWSGEDLHRPPYTTEVELTDGGVYDNMGLEPLKRFKRILVSDGGGKTQAEEDPDNNWAGHAYRVLDLIDDQNRSRRKIQIIEEAKAKERTVAYWSTRTKLAEYNTSHQAMLPQQLRDQLASVHTRLKETPKAIQEGLINWGYLACDVNLRRFIDQNLPQPGSLPYS